MPGRTMLSEEDRGYFYDAIVKLDENQAYVVTDKEKDTLFYTSNINIKEKISGRPTDEELTRALIVLRLIKTYGYKKEQLILEDSVEYSGRNITMTAFQNDIAILDESCSIYEKLIEVKRITSYHGINDSEINTQLFHPFNNFRKYADVKELYYVSCGIPAVPDSFPLVCIGIDTAKVKTYEAWKKKGRISYYIDIVPSGKDAAETVYYGKAGSLGASTKACKELNDNFGIDTIRRAWRAIWDEIWGGNLESNKKFENFNKILLAKIYDERKTPIGAPYTFQRKLRAGEMQDDESLAADIDRLVKMAWREYFCKGMDIELRDIKGIDFNEFSIDLVVCCVEQLHSFSFAKNRYKNVDILGEFYEMVIRDSFKQTKGLFLTHPNIVLFILGVLEAEHFVKAKLQRPDEDPRYRLPFVIDPSCGTGTFLVYYMNYVQKYVDEHAEDISCGDIDVEEFIRREMQGENKYKWVKDYVFGLDNELVLAVASQINQILHGDGSTNIYYADGLSDFEDYAKLDIVGAHNILSSGIRHHDYYGKDELCKFDIILSNPPFNVNINKQRLNQRFEITGKSEAYFLERWYQLLKPKGRIGVVLPESFFSVEDDVAGRLFLYKHFNVKCIVALPNFTFQPHTPTSTSLLFAEKKSEKEETAFKRKWDRYQDVFEQKYNEIAAMFPRSKTDLEENGLWSLLKQVERKTVKLFGEGVVVYPYFSDAFTKDVENYPEIKRKYKEALELPRNRWILSKVYSKEEACRFINYSVEEIGYRAGKKGAKDRPNDLMGIYAENGRQIFNVKYAHDWKTIDFTDMETALGMIRKENIWQ